jgi:folate-dependent tRNA-U54 methylase TrmFO/GidA
MKKIRGTMAGESGEPIPATTACGSLIGYVTGSDKKPFTPTSFHFGLLPGLETQTPPQVLKKISKNQKHDLLCKRALNDLGTWAKNCTPGHIDTTGCAFEN